MHRIRAKVECESCGKEMFITNLKRHLKTCLKPVPDKTIKYGDNYPNLVSSISDVVALRMKGYYHMMCGPETFIHIKTLLLMRIFASCYCCVIPEPGEDPSPDKDHYHALVECRDWDNYWTSKNKVPKSKNIRIRMIPVHCALAFAKVIHYISCNAGQSVTRKRQTADIAHFVKTNEHVHSDNIVKPDYLVHNKSMSQHSEWTHDYILIKWWCQMMSIDYNDLEEDMLIRQFKVINSKRPTQLNYALDQSRSIQDHFHHESLCKCYDGNESKIKQQKRKYSRNAYFAKQQKFYIPDINVDVCDEIPCITVNEIKK